MRKSEFLLHNYENHPEFLQKSGWFLKVGSCKEQLALPLLNSERYAHRPRYNRHPNQGSAILPNNQCSIGATAASS